MMSDILWLQRFSSSASYPRCSILPRSASWNPWEYN